LVAGSLAICGQKARGGRSSTDRSPLSDYFPFFNFLIYLFLEVWEWAGRMGVQHLHFLKFAPTLVTVKSSILHKAWKFYFFPNFGFAQIRGDLDLHIHYWDFSVRKK
jgi:hypothetical protein